MVHWTFCESVLLSALAASLTFQAPSAAAEPPSLLNCSGTKQPDGSVRYQLSQEPRSSWCLTNWELKNRTVVAFGSNFSSDHVHAVSPQSIIMKVCADFLLYKVDCPPVGIDWEETNCTVNCSLLREQELPPNSGICFGTLCLDKAAGLVTCVLPATAAVVTLIIWFVKCRKAAPAAKMVSYDGTKQEMEINV